MSSSPDDLTLALADLRTEVYRLRDEHRELKAEAFRLCNQVAAQKSALNHWRRVYDATQLEFRVGTWVKKYIGAHSMTSVARTKLGLEEMVELAQAEGISKELAIQVVNYVYDRDPGIPKNEAADVILALYGWCAAAGYQLTEIAELRLRRNESRSLESIQESEARKIAAGFGTPPEQRKNQPFEWDPKDGLGKT